MATTSEALKIQQELLSKFAEIVTALINKVNADESDKAAFLTQIAELTGQDSANAEAILAENPKLQALIDAAANALPQTEPSAPTV